jgi:hypothetical protein
MTRPPRRRRSLRATLGAIAALSGIVFIGVFGGLSYQMAASNDPALGPKERALVAALHQPPRRRIVRRTIIVRKVHVPASAGSGAPVSVDAPPVAAPQPPPARAPVVTRVS